jgi:primosomal protein N' (replication factor Y)
LIDKNIFEEYYIQHDRVNFEGKVKEEALQLSKRKKMLSRNSRKVLIVKRGLSFARSNFKRKNRNLHSTHRTLFKQGKQILYLLPEIALTTQLVGRLRELFWK